MDDSAAGVTAPTTTAEGVTAPEREHGEFEPLPATALPPPQPAGGQEIATAEAVVEPAAVTAAVAAEPTAGRRRAAVADPGQTLLDEILALKDAQKVAKDAKKQVTKELRNANRRRQRLKKRAKALSDQDLLAVISLRNHEKALGRHASAEEEDEDDDSDSETEVSAPAASASGGTPQSPARPKKRART